MKLLAIIAACLLSGCTVTVTPLPKYRSVYHRHHAGTIHRRTSSNSTLVDAKWLEEYHRLEADHGNYAIPSDGQIETTSTGKFRVPRAVLKHFDDLNHTLLPTPTP